MANDMFDDIDDEESETFSADDIAETNTGRQPVSLNLTSRPFTPPNKNLSARRVRTRAMTSAMADKFPDVVTIIMTRANGTQIVFVR